MKLAKYLKPYWLFALISPFMMMAEVAADLCLPYLMSFIVDYGIAEDGITKIATCEDHALIKGANLNSRIIGIMIKSTVCKLGVVSCKNRRYIVFDRSVQNVIVSVCNIEYIVIRKIFSNSTCVKGELGRILYADQATIITCLIGSNVISVIGRTVFFDRCILNSKGAASRNMDRRVAAMSIDLIYFAINTIGDNLASVHRNSTLHRVNCSAKARSDLELVIIKTNVIEGCGTVVNVDSRTTSIIEEGFI
jgi:ABC-type multidrug transport system fused ATPase/permease subunit